MKQATPFQVVDPKRDERHAKAYRDLEGSICDITSMAGLASEHVADCVVELRKGRELEDVQFERMTFALYHLEDMIAALKRGYYEKYSEK